MRRLHHLLIPAISIALLASCRLGEGGAERVAVDDSASTESAADSTVGWTPPRHDPALAAAFDTSEFDVYVMRYGDSTAGTDRHAPGPAIGAGTTLEARVPTRDGVLTIERQAEARETERATYRLRVNGRLMLEDRSSLGVGVAGYTDGVEEMGQVFVIRTVDGGTACPVLFHVVEIVADHAYVTPDFGDCSEAFAMETDSAAARMRFGGYYTVGQSMQEGFTFPPPSTWVYRGKGRIEMVKEGRDDDQPDRMDER